MGVPLFNTFSMIRVYTFRALRGLEVEGFGVSGVLRTTRAPPNTVNAKKNSTEQIFNPKPNGPIDPKPYGPIDPKP